jgi:hypothetical protein
MVDRLVCPNCGYDLSGLNGRCPECGRPVFAFTERARKVMSIANRCALTLRHRGAFSDQICPCHVLLAIVTGPDGVAKAVLRDAGVELSTVAGRVERLFKPTGPATEVKKLPLSPVMGRIADRAVDEAFGLGQEWVGTEHLLLALLTARDHDSQSALAGFAITAQSCRDFIKRNALALSTDDATVRDATFESPLDPLLGLDAYAIAWEGGLSSRSWRVLNADGDDIIVADQPRDPVRSLLVGAMLVVAVFGAGLGVAAAAIGGPAAVVSATVFAVCFIVVVVLAPVVVLRLPEPIRLCMAQGDRELLRVERRTRLGLWSVRYEVMDERGSATASLACGPGVWPPGVICTIAVTGHPPVHARARSMLRTVGGDTMIGAAVSNLWRLVAPPKQGAPLSPRRHFRQAGRIIATCIREDDWEWLVFEEDVAQPVRGPVLAACLMIIGQG